MYVLTELGSVLYRSQERDERMKELDKLTQGKRDHTGRPPGRKDSKPRKRRGPKV